MGNPLGAKYCTADGFQFEDAGVQGTALPLPPAGAPIGARLGLKAVLVRIIASIMLIGGAVAGYLVWSSRMADSGLSVDAAGSNSGSLATSEVVPATVASPPGVTDGMTASLPQVLKPELPAQSSARPVPHREGRLGPTSQQDVASVPAQELSKPVDSGGRGIPAEAAVQSPKKALMSEKDSASAARPPNPPESIAKGAGKRTQAKSAAQTTATIRALETQPSASPVVGSRPNYGRLQGEINRALADAGLGSVNAMVTDDFTLVLHGTARTQAEKNRAMQVVQGFHDVRSVKDRIFIVE